MTRTLKTGGVLAACVGSFVAGTWVAGWSVAVGPADAVELLGRRSASVAFAAPMTMPAASPLPEVVSPPPSAQADLAHTDAGSPDPDTQSPDDPRHLNPYWRLRHESLSMGEMAEQARRIESMSNADLDAVLERLRGMAKGHGVRATLARELLEESQQCWQAYLESQLALEYPSPDGLRYGSIVSMTIPLRRAGMIDDRVKELKSVAGDDAEEGVVGGSQWPDLDED